MTDINQINKNKITLLEHLTKQIIPKDDTDKILNEFSEYDKDVRSLTHRILLEKFNDKYEAISIDQKQGLKEFINSKVSVV